MSKINCDPSCYTHQRSQKQQEQNQLSAQELVTSIHYIGGKRKRGGNLTPLYCIRLQHRKYTKENKKTVVTPVLQHSIQLVLVCDDQVLLSHFVVDKLLQLL